MKRFLICTLLAAFLATPSIGEAGFQQKRSGAHQQKRSGAHQQKRSGAHQQKLSGAHQAPKSGARPTAKPKSAEDLKLNDGQSTSPTVQTNQP